MNKIEELLQKPYWIIDILPIQVPKDGPGQYFAVEDYFLKDQLAVIKQKHINLILKLNCYYDLIVIWDDEEIRNPAPYKAAEIVNERYVNIIMGEAMIVSEPDDTHLTLFNPDEELLDLVRNLAGSEGLFVWKGTED